MKFGGSSIASPERIKTVISIIEETSKEHHCRAVVVSAFQDVTDQLIIMARQAESGDENYSALLQEIEKRHLDAIRKLVPASGQSPVIASVKLMLNDLEDVLQGVYLVKELTPRTLDFMLSFGERLSALIISYALNESKVKNEFLDTRSLIKTDDGFGAAEVFMDTTLNNINEHFSAHFPIQLTTGFIASTLNNETSTLGRGGSDYTASLLGAALDVDVIQIWTDVDGVMTADPRMVKKAFSMEEISYEEAMEMSHFGAKVIHPPTIQPAMSKGIPIHIRNTFNPDFKGTKISKTGGDHKFAIKGLSSIDNVSLLNIQGSGLVGLEGVAQRIFGALAQGSINVILITQASSEYSLSIAVFPEYANKAKKLIDHELEYEIQKNRIKPVLVENDLCILAIVGGNMRRTPGIAGKVFQALGKNGVNISAIAQGSSELNISVVLSSRDEKKALMSIHDAFFLSGRKTLNLFLAGTGLIGSSLLNQIERQHSHLSNELMIDLRVIGLANSKKMLFDMNGMELSNWKEKIGNSAEKAGIENFTGTIKEMNLANSIFVDCSSSEEVAASYDNLLKNSISVVTPNKKANSGAYNKFLSLKQSAVKNNVRFHYETNVGAGLPVIRTIQDFVSSGDEILNIEGVLSGTLSYLFNSFTGEIPFSQLVSEAKSKGYTEPDPREDLNGMDVARKLLILSREAGFPLELKDIKIENLLPARFYEAETVDQFFEMLPEHDSWFEEKRKKAEEKGHVLRYLAQLENGTARTALMEVAQDHPCYALKSTDNLVMVGSRCYNERPLVVIGPGAGPEVTSSGVLADIIRIAN
ncbi:MAG: bifunctional aspartate kinase/homoserine dehydrogenase I [Balneolales bacterium]